MLEHVDDSAEDTRDILADVVLNAAELSWRARRSDRAATLYERARTIATDGAERRLRIEHGLGTVRLAQGELDKAQAAFEASLQHARAWPSGPDADREQAKALTRLGDVLVLRKMPARARARFEAACALLEARLEQTEQTEHPDRRLVRDLSVSLNRLGTLLLETEDPRNALSHFKRSLRLRKRIADGSPTLSSVRDLASSMVHVADASAALGDREKARTHYRRALRTMAELNRREPSNLRWLTDRVESLGRLLDVDGESNDAVTQCLEVMGSIDAAEPLARLVEDRLAVATLYELVGAYLHRLRAREPNRDALAKAVVIRRNIGAESPAAGSS